jgi:small conductance mechanosensitive channel
MFPLKLPRFKRLKQRYNLQAVILTGVVCAVGIGWTPARSQETEASEEAAVETMEVPAALEDIDPEVVITTENIDIPVDQLKLLVQPLTLAELEQEAAAWLLILQAKVKEISTAEIAIKRENESIAKQEESAAKLEAAKTALEEAEAAQTNAAPGSPEAEEAAKKVEEAKENLAEAQAAIEEATELKQEAAADDESAEVLERAAEAGELQKAQEVLDAAQKAREEMTAGSLAYDTQTEKIDALTAAIAELEKAEEAREGELPETPEYEQATQQVEAARTTLKEAVKALDPTAIPEEEDKSAEELDDLSSSLQNTDLTDGEAKIAGTPGAGDTPENLEQQGDQLEEAAEQIQQGAEEQAEAKNDLVVAVTRLQEERTGIIDRFNTILDELELKGGDGEFYRQYIQAVSGVELDLSDTEGLGVRLIGWFQSEEGGLRWVRNTGTFLGVFLAAAIAAQILGIAIDQTLKRVGGVSQLFRQFLVMLIQRGGLLVAFLLALTALEVSLGPVLALLGGVSFVLAFALQSNLGNLASGLMIMVYKPFDVGDEVKVNNLWGYIHTISLANTQIKGFNHQIITVPNNTIWGSIIENLTTQDVRRGKIPVKVPFDCDLRKVKKLLIEIGKSHPGTLKERGFSAYIYKGSDYQVSTGLKFWATADDFWTVYEDLTFMIQERFREEGISIAIPQQDVHLHHAANGNGNQLILDAKAYSLEHQPAKDKAETPLEEVPGDVEPASAEVD